MRSSYPAALTFSCTMALCLVLHSFAVYPGFYYLDSLEMIAQYANHDVNSWRSAFATVLYGVVADLGWGMYPLLAAQLLALLLSSSIILRRSGWSWNATSFAVVIIAFSPGVFISFSTLVRDSTAAPLMLAAAAATTFAGRTGSIVAVLFSALAVCVRLDLLFATIPIGYELARQAPMPANRVYLSCLAKGLLTFLFVIGLYGFQQAVARLLSHSMPANPIQSVLAKDLVRMHFFDPWKVQLNGAPGCVEPWTTLSEEEVLRWEQACVSTHGVGSLMARWTSSVSASPSAYLQARLQVSQRLLFGPLVRIYLPESRFKQQPQYLGYWSAFYEKPPRFADWYYEVPPLRQKINQYWNLGVWTHFARVGAWYLIACGLLAGIVYVAKTSLPTVWLTLLTSAVIHLLTLAVVAPRAKDNYLTWLFTACSLCIALALGKIFSREQIITDGTARRVPKRPQRRTSKPVERKRSARARRTT